ncbi:MAG TPA: methionine synthase [Mycobacteriales bacterium]|jgi:methionine synthase II (cobalamin-independent)|nr:methionine synthase [Mycobacteriales bacterium]
MAARGAPTGVATGIGSLPGEDIDASMALAFDELPDLPHLPELPARGPGSDMIGRTATQLAGLPVDLQPAGWRLVSRPGIDVRRGRDLLTRDLDALMPVAGPAYDGRLKVQLVGPWTLAAQLELPRGGKVLGDPAATHDLAQSLAETVREHLAEVTRRLPNAQLVLQLDEPSLPAVLAGHVRTASGFGALRVPEEVTVEAALRGAIEAAGEVPVAVHCCAADAPLRLFRDAGAAAVSIDVLSMRPDHDALGELVEAGVAIWAGVVPSLGPGVTPTPRAIADPVRRLWHELGFDPDLLPDSVSITPTCGLAGASPGWAHSSYRVLRQAARVLAEAPEGTSV